MNVRSVAVLITLSTLLNVDALSQTNQVPDNIEVQVLKDLFDSLGGPSWTNKTNWTTGNWPSNITSTQFRTWFGITVVNGDVSSISLPGNHLTGRLPSSIRFLTKLQKVILNNNNLTGRLTPGLLTLPLLTTVYIDNNDLVWVPDFGSYSNLANLVLRLQNNHLDFSQLERNVGKVFKSLTQTPQKTINDSLTHTFSLGNKLVLTARPVTTSTTVVWEKLGANGTTWSALTNDEDNVVNTYTRNVAVIADAGTYRWKSTNSIFIGVTIQSDPIVVKTPLGFKLDNWCFQYKYDSRRRMTHKKAPGADWVYMVYDDRDRLVMTQDGEQRKTYKWMVTKYDQLNRPVVTALYAHGSYSTQQDMANRISKSQFGESYSGVGVSGYTNTVFPATKLEVLTATYYDDYSFLSGNPDLRYNADNPNASFTVGMVTGMKVKVLDVPYYMTTVNYYDDKRRIIQSVSENYDGGMDRVTKTYDFTGKVTATRTTHSVGNLHWQNVKMMEMDGNFVKRVSSGGYGGGSSVEYIRQSVDGWAEATVTEVNTSRHWGLSEFDRDSLPSSIDYCFYLAGTTLQVLERGDTKMSLANLASGDRLRISRTGTTISYYRNGELIYISSTPSSADLRVDVSLSDKASTILNLNLSSARGTQTTLREFDYDHAGRLTTTRHCINNKDTVVLAKKKYNELGQLSDKGLHQKRGNVFSQEIGYRYNIHGWLTSLNADLFGLQLQYDNMFNGNLSGMQWKVDLGLGDPKMRSYAFSYDPMNRITGARSSAFSEDSLKYDLNGNIMRLRRTGGNGTPIDKLTYKYGAGTTSGNQLASVNDISDPAQGFNEGKNFYYDYTYDRNGNMVTDNNKDLTITYNILNLPRSVSKKGEGTIQYYYDATGRKLSQVLKDVSGAQKKTTDYHGDFIYENDTLRFASTEEGRVIPLDEPEYQYHLKDHLGNVRMTFTTKHEVDRSITNFETTNADFLYYNEAVKVNSELFDHTGSGETHYSTRLNGTPKEHIGVAKSLSVMPGDTIRVEVFAKYLDTDPSNWSAALSALITSIANGTAPSGTLVDGGAPGSTGGLTIPWSGFPGKNSDYGLAPKAYLNYLIFDRDHNFVSGDAIRLSTAAREYGQDGPHERLACDAIIRQPGYVYIYLSNDNVALGGEPVEVYFDDLKVEHVKSPVVQSQEYYPFGLVFNSYQRQNNVLDPFRFQSREHINDLGLNWDSFKWRNHMPEIGRFFNVDPLAEKYAHYSPYAFSGNRVTNAIELEGLEPLILFGSKDAAAKNFGEFYNDNSIRKNEEYGSTIYSTTVNGTTMYGYSIANIGTGGASVTVSDAPDGTTIEGDIHTHAAYAAEYANNEFSPADTRGNNILGIDGYVATPSGSLQKYDVKTGAISTVSTSMPSDPKDPARLNKVPAAPSTSTYTTQEGDNLLDLAKRFDTTVDAIANENGITTLNKIKPGTTLKITN